MALAQTTRRLPNLELVLRWGTPAKPLPIRPIQALVPLALPPLGAAPSWLDTGPTERPFDFTTAIRLLCTHITQHTAELRHIDTTRLLFGVTQARRTGQYGLQARVTPLRFRGGQLVRRRRGVSYQVQRYFDGDRELLYLMTFCLPRFLEQSFDDKLITLFHELYHIGPELNGDLRRHEGRYELHSASQRAYDRRMAELARDYLARWARPNLLAFLRLSFAQLHARHGSIVGVMVPHPKIIPLPVNG